MAQRIAASAAVALVLNLTAAPAHAAPPQRIVSLNLCVDQILVDLVPRERIAAVTHLAADASVSAAPAKLKGLRVTHGAAEDVLSLAPDLVIAGAYTTPATVDLLRRLGKRVVIMPLPDTIAGVKALIAEIATTVEAEQAGNAIIADLDSRIAKTVQTSRTAQQPSAVVYQINNYVTGRGSLLDEAMTRAGFRNAGADFRTHKSGQTSIETIITNPPDLLITATEPNDYATTVGDNLRHPVLAKLSPRTQRIVLPWPLWLCGTHHIASAIERLSAARAQMSGASK